MLVLVQSKGSMKLKLWLFYDSTETKDHKMEPAKFEFEKLTQASPS